MATKWADFKQFEEDFPNLRYVTSRDERVRPGHRKLHGVTLPMSDKFWDKYFPPCGYKCRCTAQQLGETKHIHPTELPTDAEIPKVFQFNPGKTERLFSDQHPYFKSGKPTDVAKFIDSELVKMPIFDTIFEAEKGMVQVHPLEDPNPQEQANNIEISTELAKKGSTLQLLPYYDTFSRKNPDVKINGRIGDFKLLTNFKKLNVAIQHAISSAAKQLSEICVIDLRGVDITKESELLILRGMLAGTQAGWNSSVQEIWLLQTDELVKIKRDSLRK
jgi:Phage Mu protein F like protein/Contact-dependent growth inhibition CdiA C-terminal domain